MKQFSFIFTGTSEFALSCLQLMIKSQFLILKGVISRPDVFKNRGMKKQSSVVKSFAQNQGFPVWTPQKSSDPLFLNEIAQKKCDFSLVCSYGQILPLAYLKIFPKGSLNIHLSLLPRWRGAAPVQRALMAGDKETGVCFQIMTTELDTGDIIGQRDFHIKEEDNAKDIFDKALKATDALLKEELLKYLKGKLKALPQNPIGKTYAQKINKKEGKIIWEESAQTIHNKIRALFLGPQAFSFLKGKRIKILRSRIVQKNFLDFLPGEVCSVGENSLFVSCGEGVLSLLEIQKEGKKQQKIEDFLKGYPINLKDRFESKYTGLI